jgi:ferredoxin
VGELREPCENVREHVAFICNCCGCCCEAMIAARRFGALRPVHTTNFLPVIETQTCTGCGLCTDSVPEVFEMGDDVAKVKANPVPPAKEGAGSAEVITRRVPTVCS